MSSERLLIKFREFISGEKLFSPADKLLLAVSGGVDSVVLCDLCSKAGYKFSIAHCNFQLRGEESNRDESFVKQLGKKYNKEVFVKRSDTEGYAAANKLSIQEAARELRYEWFSSFEMDYVLTAHHADDNLETVLMNLFRGTGIAGLRGILPKNDRIIRPLLFATREEILAYAKENKLDWVEDSSNESSKYKRNYLRNEILPLIEKKFPGAKNNLTVNINHFREVEDIYRRSVEDQKKKLLEKKGDEWHIPVLKLQKSFSLHTLLYEIIKDFDFTSAQVDEVVSLLHAATGRFLLSPTHRILKNRNWIIISKLDEEGEGVLLVDEKTTSFKMKNEECRIERLDIAAVKIADDPAIAFIDASLVQFPFIVRRWKQGDYFYPLGMKKKKKLARFLIDQKLSRTEKEKVWVIEMDKKIIWVIGHRIDDRFRITDKSTKILKLSLRSS